MQDENDKYKVHALGLEMQNELLTIEESCIPFTFKRAYSNSLALFLILVTRSKIYLFSLPNGTKNTHLLSVLPLTLNEY